MTDSIINVKALTRIFQVPAKGAAPKGWLRRTPMQDFIAVKDLDFTIETGQKVAFIGPNGAGKSTTLKILSGLLEPSSGEVTVCGMIPHRRIKELSHKIGLVFGQKTHLWPDLSVSDSFDLLAKIYDLDKAAYRQQREKLIEVFGLASFVDKYAQTLSLGQKMRSDLAAALLHQPSVLFLDEPTIGLDVTAKALLRDHLNKLVHEFETTILLTSHDTDDIEKICERVILIDHGQKLLDTTVGKLYKDYTQYKILRLSTEDSHPVFEHAHVTMEERGEHSLTLKVDVTQITIEKIVALCLGQFKLLDINIEGLPLEEIIKTIYSRKAAA